MASAQQSTVKYLADDIKSGTLKDRDKALDDLTRLLKNGSPDLIALEDKGYHEIFEAIFGLVLIEKPALYDKRKTQTKRNSAASRLSKCAVAIRVAAARGSAKLGRKTLLAVIDHITQVLPGPDNDFVQPLLQDYVKALSKLLTRQSHVELLARKDGAPWQGCVDFLLNVAEYNLPSERHLSAASAGGEPSVASTWRLNARSSASTQNQKRSTFMEGGALRDALEGLFCLLQAANAPVARPFQDIIGLILRILGMKHLSLGSTQTVCFALANSVFAATQADNLDLSNSLVKGLLPLMSYWWRAEKVSQDELIKALRNEISRTIFLGHLHIEHLSVTLWDFAVRDHVKGLMETLWLEYSKRSEAFRLQLHDLTFYPSSLSDSPLRLSLFGLCPHNVEGEGSWALIQNLALLNAILLRPKKKPIDGGQQTSEQAPKRRRLHESSSHLMLNLKSKDVGTQRTTLQLIPFLMETDALAREDTAELLGELVSFVSDKNATATSWALIACACCALLPAHSLGQPEMWRQLWHAATRSLSLPATCRASCLLLHAVLKAGVLPYNTLSEDLNSFVTIADVNGPAILCDTSLSLMSLIFHERNVRLPSASQTTSSHLIRWIFMKWNPCDSGYASFQATHVPLLQFVNLLRACCGAQSLPWHGRIIVSGSTLSETWKMHREMASFNEYLLLLGRKFPDSKFESPDLSKRQISPPANPNNFDASRKLTFELLHPKLEELAELCESWNKKHVEGSSHVSLAEFQSFLAACIMVALLLPQVSDLKSANSSTVEAKVVHLTTQGLEAALRSIEPVASVHLVLRLLRSCIPDITTESLKHLYTENPGLLHMISEITSLLKQTDVGPNSSHTDTIELGDEVESQFSRVAAQSTASVMPRQVTQMLLGQYALYTDTMARLALLLKLIYNGPSQAGLVPDVWMDNLLTMSGDDLMSCRSLLVEVSTSDLAMSRDSALRLIKRLGSLISDSQYQCCETALSVCIEVVEALHRVWLGDSKELSESVGDLYNYFIKVCLPWNLFSPKAQISMARLLLTLLKVEPAYGKNLGLDSCRTSLLYILSAGNMKVKFFIAEKIAGVFELYVQLLHEEIFVDVLDNLPANPEDTSGIAFRLLVLSRLACRWPTLLRRCIYHIFEAPGKIPEATDYATWCLADVARHLHLASPKDLFDLFSRQLLYTWMENDSIQDIPFSIFGFESLASLLLSAQTEAAGLAMMRGQEAVDADIARLIGFTSTEIIQHSFAKMVSYCMIYGDASGQTEQANGEDRIKKKVGSKLYMEAVHVNFVDIVALFFDLIDQEDSLDKVFRRDPNLVYAAENLKAMKSISHSSANLPPNQQPMFRAKFVMHSLFRLCRGSEFHFQDLWTPALVISVVRKLLNTVHPALGSLHACSILRKVRLVVCLAGSVAFESYCLEMLLNSIRSFIVDSECADDALGVTQYLLVRGTHSLKQTPSFMAGYALSALASLRVFLESSQASTTQKFHLMSTVRKAQTFHTWLKEYLSKYTSTRFQNDNQAQTFQSITHAAEHIRSSESSKDSFSAESKLLLAILNDGISGQGLLNESSRDLALKLLCSDFAITATDNLVESDEDAMYYASAVWRSCEARNLNTRYLAWAGRVLGIFYSASGGIPDGILRESRLFLYEKMAPPGPNRSEMGLLHLLQNVTSKPDSVLAGLAEAALRNAVSQALEKGDEGLLTACQNTLSESLFLACQWGSYHSPPSETPHEKPTPRDTQLTWTEDIGSQKWLPSLSTHLTRFVPRSIILSVLPPILSRLNDFAEKSLPFVVHLVLYFQLEHELAKRQLSTAINKWLDSRAIEAKDNLKLLLNTILYLRTQEYPGESSIEDRKRWLDVDYKAAAAAASRCGMYKTALLLVEFAELDNKRANQRSSSSKELNMNDTLLAVFENIDDPDTYYGLPEDASLATIVSRVEYENEGSKNLAFRGAQYDSHLRLRSLAAERDAQALVGALGTLGLSGLSHSLLQTQQNLGIFGPEVETTFRTATRLEMWNLPATSNTEHHTVAMYKAYQTISQGADIEATQSAIYDGYSRVMRSLTGKSLNATVLRSRLAALAALTELDDLINVKDASEMRAVLQKFKNRGQWMKSGLYDVVSQIMSYRETTTSMMSQYGSDISGKGLSVTTLRQMQVETMLMASAVYRYHQATQESLNISTTLNHLIPICADMNLHIDAAVNIEVANSLWDYGEMIPSIRMLQKIDKASSLGRQTISVSRSELLSKIGHKVSIARLEKPRDILKGYLEPALKELKCGSKQADEAGSVYHQFATFCDEQLQDTDGLEDLARLQGLRARKSDEVAELKALIASTRDSQLKNRYLSSLVKEKQWLDLDEQELRRVEQTRSEFLRLSLENYLLSLATSDEYNNDALRFTALWLERSMEETTNKAVAQHLDIVPTRKFVGLMNQLTSRLQNEATAFQKLLFDLVLRICVEHPYHGMYHIWSGTRAKVQQKDEIAVLRVRATEKVAQRLASMSSVADIWMAVDKTSKYYHIFATDKSLSHHKSGAKVALKDSAAGKNLVNCLTKFRIPPPTMDLQVSATNDYANVPHIIRLEPTMTIASGVSAPKIIMAVGSDGRRYKQLVKGGNDDLRQDAIMEQVFAAVSSLLKLHRSTQQRNLGIRTYKVLPLTAVSGLIEFVSNTIPLHEFLMPAHERYYPKDLKGSQCQKEIFSVQNQPVETRINTYRKVTDKFHPVMRYFFVEYFTDPDDWFAKRLAYTRSTAAISMLGHVLGLGDRHGHNILLDTKTGEAVHIDLGVAFEAGRILPVPELVPFRLTRDIVDGMGITKTEGVFRRCCEFTLDALREEQYSIMTILDVLRYDPLYTWSISPLRLAKLQKARQDDDTRTDDLEPGETEAKRRRKGTHHFNEPSEADRALEVVRKKLSKTLSVTATVNDLINQASDERNLAVLYSGWAAYA